MSENLEKKLREVERKIDRLNEERNKLLEANETFVDLLIELEEFIEHNLRTGKLERSQLSADNYIESSSKVDLEEVENQVADLNSMIKDLEKH